MQQLQKTKNTTHSVNKETATFVCIRIMHNLCIILTHTKAAAQTTQAKTNLHQKMKMRKESGLYY